jgi:hypothetical protein
MDRERERERKKEIDKERETVNSRNWIQQKKFERVREWGKYKIH